MTHQLFYFQQVESINLNTLERKTLPINSEMRDAYTPLAVGNHVYIFGKDKSGKPRTER